MSIMNSFVNDIFERIAGEASRLAIITTALHHHLPGRSRPPSASSCPESWPSTPSRGHQGRHHKYTSAK
ncbi:unnamed protein product [Staurois parvus]|uniref:Uncharacterized protein n=1 Tax=Staurois parvus TaxID=386267 RepID=A0ABN9BJV1_9NEOB|nr:unnamed protein product [Staurois parvus]